MGWVGMRVNPKNLQIEDERVMRDVSGGTDMQMQRRAGISGIMHRAWIGTGVRTRDEGVREFGGRRRRGWFRLVESKAVRLIDYSSYQ